MYDRVADLPLSVEDCAFDRQERATSSGFDRATTTVTLSGEGLTGQGEDVTYTNEAHDALVGHEVDLTGTDTLDELSARLDDVELWPEPPDEERFRHYRRWAFESAALDLALKQAGTNLGAALDRHYHPVSFVASTRLSNPQADESPTADRLTALQQIHDDVAFKLDPTPDWDDMLIATLNEFDVRVLDMKGLYDDERVASEPDPVFYRRIVDGFPSALIEDPKLTGTTREILDGEEHRVTWDLPITGIESIEALPFEPEWLNMKPSRCGTVAAVLETIAYCESNDIALYGGGQFELDVGRDHIQALASLCYADAPNDVAPGGYNDPDPAPDLPASPLAPPADPAGIGVGFGPE